MNEMNNAPRNRPVARPNMGGGAGGGAGGAGGGWRRRRRRCGPSDHLGHGSLPGRDRPAAEEERGGSATRTRPRRDHPVAPVVQPAKPVEKPRPRVVAELAEPAPRPTDVGFGPPVAPTQPSVTTGPKAGDLPMATVVGLPSGTGAAGDEGDAPHAAAAAGSQDPVRQEPHHTTGDRSGAGAGHRAERSPRPASKQEGAMTTFGTPCLSWSPRPDPLFAGNVAVARSATSH